MPDYNSYNALFSNTPDSVNPEDFYTPELQQAILDALSRNAEQGRQQAQAEISGSAIRSGFGVGGTSREATRRAAADANALDQVINGYVSQAAQLETMKTKQAQEEATNKFNLEENRKNNQQAFDLAKQGYQANLDVASRAYSDQRKQDTQDMYMGGLNLLGQMGGSWLAKKPAPTSPGGMVNVNGTPMADTRAAVWYSPSQYRA